MAVFLKKMNLKPNKRKYLFLLLFCLLSFVAGGINGFLGTGGGIIFIIMLSTLTNNDPKDNYASSLCATLPISIIGIFAYLKNSNVDGKILTHVGIPAVLGGALGAFLVDKFKTKWLNVVFAILVIYSGINMLLK